MKRTVMGLTLLLAACGQSGHTASPSPRPTPTPAPDVEQVNLVASGVGSYLLQAQAVAVVQNVAKSHVAHNVTAHFVLHNGGATHAQDSPPLDIGPGQTMALAPDVCTDACDRAQSVDVTVSVGSWTSGAFHPITSSTPSYSCVVSCGAGSGQGQVSATLAGTVPDNAPIRLVAACEDAAGAITAAGATTNIWPEPAARTAPASLGVLFRSPPVRCDLYATIV